MNVFISGSSRGIGLATARVFLKRGFRVFGFDLLPPGMEHPDYHHLISDVSHPESLPEMEESANILVSNAGVQDSGKDIDVNLKGSIRFAEKYAFQDSIRSVLFIASASAHSGAEFPEYSASKGGVIAYMKNAAIRLAKFGATCNSLSPGGVTTELNRPVMEDPVLWDRIMELTPLKRWASPEEIAEWVFFLTAVNRSCTGQDILIDNGEKDLNARFIWP